MIEIGPTVKFAISIVFLILGVAGLALLLDVVITAINAEKYSAIGTILAAIVAIPALFFVGFQAMQLRKSVDLQVDAFQLEHRPYLFLQLPQVSVWRNDPEGGWFGGGDLRFKNVGKDPATITTTRYMVASDTRGEIDFVGWFEKEFGGFPDIKMVFPGQEDARVPCHPNISPGDKKPRLLFVGAVISYVGPNADRRYWYKFSQVYVLRFVRGKDKQERILETVEIHPLKPDHDWDRNMTSAPPDLEQPKWTDYLSQSYIKTLTQGTTN